MEHLGSVIVFTDQLMHFVQPCVCQPGMRLITLDVTNLYPSVDRRHLLSLVAPFLRQRVKAGLSDSLVRVLDLVMEACVVSFEGKYFRSQNGIPTGLQAASILANTFPGTLILFLSRLSVASCSS